MKTTKSDDVELLYCTALTCAVFQELELVQDQNFFFPRQTCPFRRSHLARMKHNHSCLQTGVAVAARESVSSSHTCNLGNWRGSMGANVLSRTSQSGWHNRRAGWYIQRVLLCKSSVPAENGQYKRLDDISEDDITGFYRMKNFHWLRRWCSHSEVALVSNLSTSAKYHHIC